MQELTSLLTAPFFTAELDLAISLEKSGYQQFKVKISSLCQVAQTTFIQNITDSDDKIDVTSISFYLNLGLSKFYNDFKDCFPGSILPIDLWNNINHWAFFFPTETSINWIKLQEYFIIYLQTIRNTSFLPRLVPHIRLAFSFTCRRLISLKLPFDENIIEQELGFVENILTELAKENLFHSLERYDQPPLQIRYREIKELVAVLNEQKIHVLIFNIPPFSKPSDRTIYSTSDYITIIDSLLLLYEAKMHRLLSTIKLENDKFYHGEYIGSQFKSSDKDQSTKAKGNSAFIKLNARLNLFEQLAQYIEETSHSDLKDLIEGKNEISLITINCQQNKLGRIFYEAYEAGCTSDSKKNFVQWICNHFQRCTDGQIFALTESTMSKHLKGVDIEK